MDERASVDGVYGVVYQQPGILTTEYQVDAGSPEEAVEIAEKAGLFVADDAWEGEGPKMPALVSWHGVLKHETAAIWPSLGGLPHDWEGQFQQGPQGSD
jgi:hypothetical protein